jgi:hypothetical protein
MRIPSSTVASLFWFAVCLTASGQSDFRGRDLSDYECFTDGFPRTLLFRSGEIVRWHRQGVLDHHLGMFDADTRKYVGEETSFIQEWIDIMAEFKRRHPRKLSLIHLNGEGRGVYRKEGHRYFPGHWNFYPGEILNHDLSAGDQVVSVANPVLFSSRTYRKRERGAVTDVLLPPVIIVPLAPDGSKLWSQSEYAEILAINPRDKTLRLDRGKYFSTARDFVSGRAYLAPIHSEYWGAGTMWTLNLSSRCPSDAQGRTAGDIWLQEIKEWCGPGGLAQHVDGIGFDVIFFKAKFDAWDLDADGKSDAGVAESGEDFSTRGQYDLMKRLRREVGPHFLLTSDGWDHKTQRAVGVFNGMESEGLCMPNDGWRKISETLNTQRYWTQRGDAKYTYSYITSKLEHPEDPKSAGQLYRMGLGTACVLGVSYTNASVPARKDGLPMIPEMHRGRADEPNWLGQPVGEMRLLPKQTADVLNGNAAPFSQDLVSKLETRDCKVSRAADGSLLIEGTSGNPRHEMVVTLRGLKVTAGDLAVFFEAMAMEPLAGFEPGERIPRQIIVHAEGMPKVPADQIGRRPMYNDILALMGTGAWQENGAYFRNAGGGTGTIDVSLRIENQGACRIRNLTAHLAPMGFAREFERGVVLVNASQEAMVFDLAQLFPAALAKGLWRIRADPEAYVAGEAADRMLRINDGSQVSSPQVTLPPLDGLFLCKLPQ